MTARPKIILATLPHSSRLALNVPMAAGCLKAAVHKFGLLDDIDIQILSPEVASYFGCRMLVEKIVALKPAILGFTLYLWNVERSLHIAREVKKELPDVRIVVGGPEVSREAIHILSDPAIDIAVHGEGEMTFVEIVKMFLRGSPQLREISGVSYRQDGEIIVTAARRELQEMADMPSPYLLGYLDPRQSAQMMIFTTRGCLQGCTYCLWSGRGRLRPFALDRIRQELMLAKKAEGVIRVGIWDSAFNVSPLFAAVCEMIQEINSDKRLRFTCFLLGDRVNEETARLLRQANFAHVEVGLQSSNPAVLSHIGRGVDLAKFVAGVRILEQEGIRVKVDTILGLPGDSPTTFGDTMRFCEQNRLNYQICSLSLGYGTVLRRRQAEFGLRIRPDPPYFVWETATFTRAELDTVRERHLEKCLDLHKLYDLSYPAIVPSLPLSFPENSHDSIPLLQNLAYPIRNIVLKMDGSPGDANQAIEMAEVMSKKVESRLNLLYLGDGQTLLDSVWLIKELLTRISAQNPYLICDVLLDTGEGEVSQALLEDIRSSIRSPVRFEDRLDEIFPAKLPFALRRRANVFVVMHGGQDPEKEPGVDDSNCIRIACIPAQKPLQPLIQEILKAKAGGLLIEFEREFPIDLIRSAMELLVETEKNIYFKDWVLQSIWELEFLNFPSSNQSHYEVAMDRDLNVIARFFDENELWLLTLTRRTGHKLKFLSQ